MIHTARPDGLDLPRLDEPVTNGTTTRIAATSRTDLSGEEAMCRRIRVVRHSTDTRDALLIHSGCESAETVHITGLRHDSGNCREPTTPIAMED